MPNAIKYSAEVAETNALKKGNFYIGTGDQAKGPTSLTNFWNGIDPPTGGYAVYQNRISGGPSIRIASNEEELIRITNSISGAGFTTFSECMNYFNTENDKMVLGANIEPIITDGLTLCLLPHNVISYNSGSTSWYDIAQGLKFNSNNTLTPLQSLGGYPGFAFNGSGFWNCSTNSNLVDLGGDCTVIFWVYGSQGAVRKTIFEKAGTIYASYEQELAITWETTSAFSYYSRKTPTYDTGAIAQTTANAWNMMAVKLSTGKTTACRTGFSSKNGTPWVADFLCRSNTALVPAGEIRIGTGYTNTCTNGGIGAVLCYNRMLSDAEISAVYEAMKNSYGL
jgi:hypothetical protein